jgi:Kae1-associated kinase Bud32
MQLLGKAAEAEIILENDMVRKLRVAKKYRHPKIDADLRRKRTAREAKNIKRAAEKGVNVPKIHSVDERENEIVMEYIPGPTLKKAFDEGVDVGGPSIQVGESLRLLHSANIIHNDLTTTNLILSPEGKVYFIDFGLSMHSTRLEDKAMDLTVFKKSISATHPMQAKQIWDSLLKGYAPDKHILKRMNTIEKRARYK